MLEDLFYWLKLVRQIKRIFMRGAIVCKRPTGKSDHMKHAPACMIGQVPLLVYIYC